MSDKVRSAIWPHEGVGYYPDIAFPYNLFTAPTVGSRAGRQIQGIRIRLGLESRRHASNAQCIYSLLNSERLGYCLLLDLTNFTWMSRSRWSVHTTEGDLIQKFRILQVFLVFSLMKILYIDIKQKSPVKF